MPFRAVAAQGWIPTLPAETAGLDPLYVTVPTQMLTRSIVFQDEQKTQKCSQSLLVLVRNTLCSRTTGRFGPEDLFLILGYDSQHPKKALTLSWCFMHRIHAARARGQGAGCPWEQAHPTKPRAVLTHEDAGTSQPLWGSGSCSLKEASCFTTGCSPKQKSVLSYFVDTLFQHRYHLVNVSSDSAN